MRFRFPALLTGVALAAALLVAQSDTARAMQAASPSALINQLVSQATALLKDKQMAEPQREAKFRNLLKAGFDIPRISRFVLGRYWRSATDQQREQFLKLFEDWIVRTYSARFRSYSGETIRVTGTRPESGATTVVLSQFISPGGAPPAKVEWHVRKTGKNDYAVVDVSVEGVSMALTERDQIAAVADRNGGTIDGLNRALQQKINGTASASAR